MKKIVLVWFLISSIQIFPQLVYWELVSNYEFFYDIKATSNGNIFACSQDFDGLLKSTDGGTSWYHANSGNGTYRIAVDKQDIIYAGTRQGYPGIHKSTDYGATWSTCYEPGLAVTAKHISKKGQIYVGDREGSFLKSTNAGNSWTKDSISKYEITSITTISTGQIFITMGSRLFTSSNNGASWNQVIDTNIPFTVA